MASPSRLRRVIVLIAVACVTPSRPGDIGRARLAAARKEIVDQFDVILEDRRGLGRTRFFKAPRLHRLAGQFDWRLGVAVSFVVIWFLVLWRASLIRSRWL